MSLPMFNVFSRLFDTNERELKRLRRIVEQINSLEEEIKKLRNEEFAGKTEDFRKRIEKGEKLSSVLPEAFALAREASWRTIGLRPYDVQLMAAIALFEGKVAEQKTGEGKTLSAVLPLYLRALKGKGTHLVTVNDYLARRDAGWNGPIFNLLGLTVGVIIQEGKSFLYDPEHKAEDEGDERLAHLKPVSRKEAYKADVTYGTNNEFGFDYLRDNMVGSLEERVQRGHYYAIVDEVDSILIDEARTPLIISAPDTEPTDKYYKFAELVGKLNSDTDYTVDEKAKSATLTEHGIAKIEKILGVSNLYEKDFDSIHHIENALRARSLYIRDKDYIVKENQVIIVDEFTGRLMVGRRWSDGLHQAVEAKEGVQIQQESKTLATISFQNYFRMYKHLAGMTGTAATEAEEFGKIYGLDVVVIPTHRPNARVDHSDVIYKTLRAKYGAVVEEIEKKHKKGQPVLVGTTSIEKNEIISEYLKRKRIPHNVLNAKNHQREAMIIAQAGRPGAVTVATNMAGRGVDIVLGGSPPDTPPGVDKEKHEKSKEYKKWKEDQKTVLDAGGLHVIGTERHESRRIDNQLRGRSGRQGDPGSTKFFLSLEDDLMRIFGGERISNLMSALKVPEDQPIENKLISKAIEQSQARVEGFNFDMRKRVVEFDDVANQQREIVYGLRTRILKSENLKKEVLDKLEHQVDRILLLATSADTTSLRPDEEKVLVGLMDIIPFDEDSQARVKEEISKRKDAESLKEFMVRVLHDAHKSREAQVGEEVMRRIEKHAYLSSIDHLWIDHIDRIDDLREGIGLRAYAQKDPLVEFKNEAYSMFEGLIDRIDEEIGHRIFRIGVIQAPPSEIPLEQARTNVDQADTMGLAQAQADQVAQSGQPAFEGSLRPSTSDGSPSSSTNQQAGKKKKIGRNDPCPCGAINPQTNKPYKYKKCGLINAPYHKG